jgi:hypothetical protein
MMSPYPDQSRISQEEPLPPESVTGKPDLKKPIYFFENRGLSGPYFILYAGQIVRDLNTTAWNERISSVLLSPKTEVGLYAGSLWQGEFLDNSAKNSESNGRWMYADLETLCAIRGCTGGRLLKKVTIIKTYY